MDDLVWDIDHCQSWILHMGDLVLDNHCLDCSDWDSSKRVGQWKTLDSASHQAFRSNRRCLPRASMGLLWLPELEVVDCLGYKIYCKIPGSHIYSSFYGLRDCQTVCYIEEVVVAELWW